MRVVCPNCKKEHTDVRIMPGLITTYCKFCGRLDKWARDAAGVAAHTVKFDPACHEGTTP